jgi:hypothetical protein
MKPNRVTPRVILLGCFLFSLVFFNLRTIIGNASVALTGVVSTQDGHPIANVLVYGSLSKACCPYKSEQTRTDSAGRFIMHDPGAVIHFVGEKFQPKTWIVNYETTEVHIILEPDSNPFVIPPCKPLAKGMRRIVGGFMGLSFDVPKKNLQILGGKPDTDYVRWVIKPRSGTSYLSLWFGAHAMDPDPDDELLLDSLTISERNVENPKGDRIGKDTFGQMKNGDLWRHLWVGPGDGAVYRAAASDTQILDQVVNSACKTPRRD